MSVSVPSRAQRIDQLRADIRALTSGGHADRARLPFGDARVDGRLAGSGLATNALHEIAGASASLADDAAATLFAAGIAARMAAGAVILWVMARTDLFTPGLAQAGLAPDRLVQVDARRDEDALAVMEEGLRHGGLAAVVGEVARIGMTASRRLQLAAEEGGTMALVLRRWRRPGMDPAIEPSAAVTRWKIGCAPSSPLPVAGIGRPRWTVSLVRQRGGDPWTWLLEGCDAQGCVAIPAELADRPAAPDRRQDRRAA